VEEDEILLPLSYEGELDDNPISHLASHPTENGNLEPKFFLPAKLFPFPFNYEGGSKLPLHFLFNRRSQQPTANPSFLPT
jgi:hypothetical protein